MVDTNLIFRKTHKGLEEIERRTWRVPPRERLLLIQVDGKKTLGTLADKTGFERDGLATAHKLLAGGFIEQVPGTGLGIGGPARRESLPGAGHVPAPVGGVLLSRPMQSVPPRGPAHVSVHAAAAASRPAASHTPAAKPSRAVQAPPAHSERRTPSWLTSTVAHLTNLFTQADSQGDVVARDTRPAAPPSQQPPPAPRRPAGQSHHIDPDDSLAHMPVIDLTAEAESRFVARPTAAEQRPAATPTRQDATKSGHQRFSADFPLAAMAVGEPRVDLTDPSDLLWRKEFPLAVPPPEPPLATPLNSVTCVGKSACAACVGCPGNAVSLARGFMNRSLLRLSGNGAKSMTQTLERCRTLAELQGQFEPWLRNLLLTPEGRTEAPALVANLQRILLQ